MIWNCKNMETTYSEEMMEISDQDISVFLKDKETNENKRQMLFDIFQKTKIGNKKLVYRKHSCVWSEVEKF